MDEELEDTNKKKLYKTSACHNWDSLKDYEKKPVPNKEMNLLLWPRHFIAWQRKQTQ